MNKREIIILDCNEIKCHLVVKFVYIELCGYFIRQNYTVKIINNVKELTNNCIVFMGNNFNCKNPCELLNLYAPDAIYIGWYWHNIDVATLKYFIYTYENVMNIYFDSNRINEFIKMTSSPNNVPLLLRANDDPLLIGKYPRLIENDYCYMGWEYCNHLIPSNKFKGIYYGIKDHSKFLDYETRKQIYLSSIFALGFQSDGNIGYKHVSQRIYEGLAYGCIVFSNSLPACEQTNNIVIYITSLTDLENKMIYYKNNPKLIMQKQNEGYEFIRKFGTNQVSVNKFGDLIKSNFGIEI
jgi:hypothetical protein